MPQTTRAERLSHLKAYLLKDVPAAKQFCKDSIETQGPHIATQGPHIETQEPHIETEGPHVETKNRRN